MTQAAISKLDAAQRQLDCAIRLLDSEDLAAHTLAYAAYCLLRDLLGARAALRKLEKLGRLDEVPNFLKHADYHPEAILNEHSPNTAHLTIRLAIRLWEEQGKEQTEPMREFCKRPDPYKPGYRHSAALEHAKHGDITNPEAAELERMVTLGSTGGTAITRAPRRRR